MAVPVLNVVAVKPTNLGAGHFENTIKRNQREDLTLQIAEPARLPVRPGLCGSCELANDCRRLRRSSTMLFRYLSILRLVQRLGFFRESSREISNCLRVDFGLIPLLQNAKIGSAFRPRLTSCPAIAFQIVCRRSERIEPTMD
jgi:hypothetical protein